MAKKQGKAVRKAPAAKAKRKIEQYDHKDKTRMNNPPVGLVTPQTESPESPKKTYAYDPHIDPSLQWAGKAERLSFEVPSVSLHVHERIDPRTIIEAVRRKNGNGHNGGQLPLFETADENPPLRDAIDFYRHDHNWTNRLIAGDSLLVMNSLLEKEGMAGKVQVVYIDPPYGIKYGSNFQPFVNNRDVKDGKDEDLTAEPEMVRAFRDTWELGLHSYLSYLRDRLLLARELLSESGSVFVQISDENVHHVREVLDEVFGTKNYVALITFAKTSGSTQEFLSSTTDYLLFYARDKEKMKYRQIYMKRESAEDTAGPYQMLHLPDGSRRRMSAEEKEVPKTVPLGAKVFRLDNLQSQSVGRDKGVGAACWFPVKYKGREWFPSQKNRWKTNEEGMTALLNALRVEATATGLYYVRYADDFPYQPVTSLWQDTVIAGFASQKAYVVETSTKVVQRCLLMTTDPGDLVLDITCGSGTTAYIAEQWGRRWITCDTSRVAIALAKQRLLTALFDYYKLARADGGVGSGFLYKTVQHITLKSIVNNEKPGLETLYDQPIADASKARVAGPFTVEAVPAPSVRPVGDVEESPAADESLARSGGTIRARDWRDELLKTGVRGRRGERIEFTRVEPLPGTRWLHADAETKEEKPKRVVISFGPDHAPLEQKQVELAWEESRTLNPKPAMILFAAFQFDPEAAKDIDDLTPQKTGTTFLKIQMNTDLLTEDLKKKRSSNESFWLVGQPDVELRRIAKGEDKGKYQVQVNGFDYYNPRTGTVESGDTSKIAMWMLDTDYDGRSLYPRQVFFPMAGAKEGWAKLAKNLKAEIDEERIEAYRGTVSLAFEAGGHKRVAVKIIDDRGIESLKIVGLE
ncbi:MAG: site-specific DNA-methyltransferase [Planctomycetota bacterium]|nr:site-specific DNA-methyltransferase [Planctomycetota bacterium]